MTIPVAAGAMKNGEDKKGLGLGKLGGYVN